MPEGVFSRSLNHSLSLLSVVNEAFEKLVNNRIVDHRKEMWHFFSDFQYSFRSSQSTANLLTFVSNRIARVFTKVRNKLKRSKMT